MSTEEERKILDDIKKTGYPLEIEVARWLMQRGWVVFPQYMFFDEVSKKIRTIDIVAYYFSKQMKIWDLPILAVECKKSDKPWVFYSTSSPMREPIKFVKNMLYMTSIGSSFLHLIQQHIDWSDFLESPPFSDETRQLINEIHFFDKDLPRAHSCYIAYKKDKNEYAGDFHKALYQIRGAYERISKGFVRTPIFPVIVLRGKMFEYLKEDEKEELRQANHILYSALIFFPEDFEPTKQSYPPSVIDVVRDTYFPKYLEILKKDFESLERVRLILKGET